MIFGREDHYSFAYWLWVKSGIWIMNYLCGSLETANTIAGYRTHWAHTQAVEFLCPETPGFISPVLWLPNSLTLTTSASQQDLSLHAVLHVQDANMSLGSGEIVTDGDLSLLWIGRAGSEVVRMDPLCFLAGCLARWLNQVLSVLYLIMFLLLFLI